MVDAFNHLGFPPYFRLELGVAKVCGVLALLCPAWRRLNEWAYAGFFITIISAVIAHSCVGDPWSHRLPPLMIGLLLVVSYALRGAGNKAQR